MKHKLASVTVLVAAGIVGAVAWLVHVKSPSQPSANQPVELSSPSTSKFPEAYRATFERGLDFLVKKQLDDGHWEDDEGNRPVAMTGLAGLALLLHDSNPRIDFDEKVDPAKFKASYIASIRKAVDWLSTKCSPDRGGLIYSDDRSEAGYYMRSHGLATIFLAGVCQCESEKDRATNLRAVVARAVQYIEKSQSSRGGWHVTSKLEGHDLDAILPTAIQVQALLAAQNAHVVGKPRVVNDALSFLTHWLEAEATRNKLPTNDAERRARLVDIAAALACRPQANWVGNVGDDYRVDKLSEAYKHIFPPVTEMKFGRDDLRNYYYAQNVFLSSIDYRTDLFERLKAKQLPDGSWPIREGSSVNSAEAAAIWCTIMQISYYRHPSTVVAAYMN